MYRTQGVSRGIGDLLPNPIPGGSCRRFVGKCFSDQGAKNEAASNCAANRQPQILHDWSCEEMAKHNQIASHVIGYWPQCEIKDLPVCTEGLIRYTDPLPIAPPASSAPTTAAPRVAENATPVFSAAAPQGEEAPLEKGELVLDTVYVDLPEKKAMSPVVVGLSLLAVGGIGAAIYFGVKG